ncbi:MAG: hypothetical protein ACK5OW_01805 [bacterium]|jgi:hypothetical protein
MKLKNKYKEIKTGFIFKVTNFTTTLDGIVDIIHLRRIDNDDTLEVGEDRFQKNFINVYDEQK